MMLGTSMGAAASGHPVTAHNIARSVNAGTSGALYTWRPSLAGKPITFSKISGSANLAISGASGVVSATAPIAAGQTQTALFSALSATGVELRLYMSFTAAGAPYQVALSRATFLVSDPAGSTIGDITGVPPGQIPTVAPNDGRLAIAGNEATGWRLVVGVTASAAGIIANVTIAASGALAWEGDISVRAATAIIDPSRAYGLNTNGVSMLSPRFFNNLFHRSYFYSSDGASIPKDANYYDPAGQLKKIPAGKVGVMARSAVPCGIAGTYPCRITWTGDATYTRSTPNGPGIAVSAPVAQGAGWVVVNVTISDPIIFPEKWAISAWLQHYFACTPSSSYPVRNLDMRECAGTAPYGALDAGKFYAPTVSFYNKAGAIRGLDLFYGNAGGTAMHAFRPGNFDTMGAPAGPSLATEISGASASASFTDGTRGAMIGTCRSTIWYIGPMELGTVMAQLNPSATEIGNYQTALGANGNKLRVRINDPAADADGSVTITGTFDDATISLDITPPNTVVTVQDFLAWVNLQGGALQAPKVRALIDFDAATTADASKAYPRTGGAFIAFAGGADPVNSLGTMTFADYVEFCGVANVHCCFPIAVGRSKDTIRKMARYARDNLPSHLRVEVGFMNEVWNQAAGFALNSAFLTMLYMKLATPTHGSNNGYQNVYRHAYAWGFKQTMAIFIEEFAGQPDRLFCIFEGLQKGPWTTTHAMMIDTLGCIDYMDGFADAPYHGAGKGLCQGQWKPGTAYAYKDFFTDFATNQFYMVTTSGYVSGATLAADVAAKRVANYVSDEHLSLMMDNIDEQTAWAASIGAALATRSNYRGKAPMKRTYESGDNQFLGYATENIAVSGSSFSGTTVTISLSASLNFSVGQLIRLNTATVPYAGTYPIATIAPDGRSFTLVLASAPTGAPSGLTITDMSCRQIMREKNYDLNYSSQRYLRKSSYEFSELRRLVPNHDRYFVYADFGRSMPTEPADAKALGHWGIQDWPERAPSMRAKALFEAVKGNFYAYPLPRSARPTISGGGKIGDALTGALATVRNASSQTSRWVLEDDRSVVLGTGLEYSSPVAARIILQQLVTQFDGSQFTLESTVFEVVGAAIAVPDAPSLTLVAEDGNIHLAWMFNGSNGAPITESEIWVGTLSNNLTPYDRVDTTQASIYDYQLTNGQTRYFAVRARNEAGWSPLSEVKAGTAHSGAPPLGLSGTTFNEMDQPGRIIGAISNVPSGQTPTVSPNDGRFAIAGNEGDGWRLVKGLSASAAGSVNITIAATGATSFTGTLTIGAASLPQTGAIVTHFNSSTIPAQADNSNLTSWTDSSGNAIAASVPAGQNPPKYRTGGIGGRPAVEFTGLVSAGLGTMMTIPSPGILKTTIDNQEYTVLMVVDNVTTSSNCCVFGTAEGGDRLHYTANGATIGRNGGALSLIPFTGTGYMHFGETASATSTLGGTNAGNVHRYYARGCCKSSDISTTIKTTNGKTLCIGGGNIDATPTYFFKGRLYRIVVWNVALTPDEVEQAEAYFNVFYGQTHPAITFGKMLHVDGDSRHAAIGVAGSNIAGGVGYKIAQSLGYPLGTWNVWAKGSLNIQHCINKGSEIDAVAQRFPSLQHRLIYEESVNSRQWPVGSTADPTSMAGRTKTYLDARRAGMPNLKIVGATPFDHADINNPQFGTHGWPDWLKLQSNWKDGLGFDGLADIWSADVTSYGLLYGDNVLVTRLGGDGAITVKRGSPATWAPTSDGLHASDLMQTVLAALTVAAAQAVSGF